MRFAWLAALLLVACGGDEFSSGAAGSGGVGGSAAMAGGGGSGARGGSGAKGGAAGSGAEGGAAGSGANGGSGGAPVSDHCPASPPDLSAPCLSGLKCSYGDDLRPSCRARYECEFGAWTVTDTACPAIDRCESLPTLPVVGQVCNPAGAWCVWDSGLTCGCLTCSDSGCSSEPSWDCRPAPAEPCPSQPPNFGQPCDLPVGECEYGLCGIEYHYLAKCDSGVWRLETPVCL